jgi:hypothetical protein
MQFSSCIQQLLDSLFFLRVDGLCDGLFCFSNLLFLNHMSYSRQFLKDFASKHNKLSPITLVVRWCFVTFFLVSFVPFQCFSIRICNVYPRNGLSDESRSRRQPLQKIINSFSELPSRKLTLVGIVKRGSWYSFGSFGIF